VKRALLAAVVLASACSPSRRETAASPSATVSASGVTAVTSAVAATVTPASARASDARWIAARDEDPAALMRLAASEGAAGLLDGLDDGGETAATALRALPHADDAEAALGRLGARAAAAATSEQRGPLVATILAIAGEPRKQREALDAEGARSCGEAMIALASRADLPREDRATAVSAARALAEKGYADPRKIPGDLDPK
jgi:hypothetical protein